MATTKLTGTLIRSGSIPTTALGGGVVTSSTQITDLIPAGTVSSSTQVDYNSITNKLSGVVSASGQVQPLLPGGTVSSSGQVDITATSGYTTFSSSLATVDAGQTTRIDNLASLTSSYAINSTIQSQLAGVASSSAQVKEYLPNGTVTSSAQYPGWVTASSQIDYNSITNKLSGVVSSSTQVKPLLPAGTVSSSAQVQLNGITGTTFATADFTFPQNLTVAGTLTAEEFITEYVSASVIYESGSSKFGDTVDDVMSVTGSILVLGGRISGSMTGMFSSSAQVDYNSIQNKLSGVVSSSTQVKPLLPDGTVSSSAQQVVSTYTNATNNYLLTATGTGGINGESNLTFDGATLSIAQSSANPTLILTDSSINDPYMRFVPSQSANTFALGLDDSDGDKFKLSYSTTLGTNDRLTVDTAGNVGIGTTTPSEILTVVGTGSFDVVAPRSDNTGFVGTTGRTWAGGEFTNLTINSTLSVRGAVDLADNDILRLGSSDDWEFFHDATNNYMDLNVGDLIIRDGTTTRMTIERTTGNIITSGSQFSGIVSGSGTQYRFVVPVGTNLYAT